MAKSKALMGSAVKGLIAAWFHLNWVFA